MLLLLPLVVVEVRSVEFVTLSSAVNALVVMLAASLMKLMLINGLTFYGGGGRCHNHFLHYADLWFYSIVNILRNDYVKF